MWCSRYLIRGRIAILLQKKKTTVRDFRGELNGIERGELNAIIQTPLRRKKVIFYSSEPFLLLIKKKKSSESD